MVGCDKIWTLCGSIPPKLPLKEIFPHNHCHRSQSHYSILPKECCELCCVQNTLSSLTIDSLLEKRFPSIKWFEYQDKTKVQISLMTFSAVCLRILSISLSSMSFWPLEWRLNWISPFISLSKIYTSFNLHEDYRKYISNLKQYQQLSFFILLIKNIHNDSRWLGPQ